MVCWKIKFTSEAQRVLKKLDPYSKSLIESYLDDKVLKCDHPEQLGKPLSANLKGLWRYRVDKFRIICSIQENVLTILVVKIGLRNDVYN